MSSHRLIREGRRNLGMSEQQFADAVDVSRGAVQQWEKPGGTAPKRSNQHRVAELLGISVAELVSGGSNTGQGLDMRSEVPLVSEVEAGDYTVIDNFKPKGNFDTVPVSVPVKRHTYALAVQGDSMVSDAGDSFPPGSIIVVEPELAAVPRQTFIERLSRVKGKRPGNSPRTPVQFRSNDDQSSGSKSSSPSALIGPNVSSST